MSGNNILVQSENATAFFDTMTLEAARNAHLGKPSDFQGNSVAYNAVQSANSAMAEGIDYVKRIARDETKNDVL